jgi:hypothetical protein
LLISFATDGRRGRTPTKGGFIKVKNATPACAYEAVKRYIPELKFYVYCRWQHLPLLLLLCSLSLLLLIESGSKGGREREETEFQAKRERAGKKTVWWD